MQDFEKAADDLNRAELEHQHLKDANILRIERLNLELEMLNHDFSRQQFLVNELLRKIDELAIASPVTGVVGNVEVNEMDFVSQYQVLLSVVDLSVYEVEVEVPESHADDLALCREIVEAHNGQIGLSNIAEGGLEVRIKLPV